jgi:hypothetical protein
MTRPPDRPLGRLPDFYIVGHPKSGTTALYEMLRGHSEIFMPDLKEPRYFAPDLRARFQPAAPTNAPRLQLPETFAEYLALFTPARPDQLIGEASPSYLRSTAAAGLIAAAQPSAKIVAVLREPAGFLRSLHLEFVQNHVEQEQDLRRAFAKEQLPSSGTGEDSPPGTRYTDRVRYVEQLERYAAVFPPEQILVLIYDDFRRDNEGTVRKVLRFLGVDHSEPISIVEANPTVHVRSLRADRFVRSLYAKQGPVARGLKGLVRRLPKGATAGSSLQGARRRLLYGRPKPPDEEFMLELRRRFRGEVAALGEYLGRDLISEWGYDRLD